MKKTIKDHEKASYISYASFPGPILSFYIIASTYPVYITYQFDLQLENLLFLIFLHANIAHLRIKSGKRACFPVVK